MFERFLRFVEVRRAIERGRLEHAFELLEDREIRDHKKAAELRELCAQKLRERADLRLQLGEETLVRQDLDLLARRCPEDSELPRRREALDSRQKQRESEASSRTESEAQVRKALESG